MKRHCNQHVIGENLCTKMFSEFSVRSSIHGLRYVGERNRIFDVVFWTVALSIACICCVIFITDLWISWQSKPISFTHDGTMVDVKNIAFPAITICPLNKLSEYKATSLYEKVYDFIKTRNCSLSEDE